MKCEISRKLGGFCENEAKGKLVLDSEGSELVKSCGKKEGMSAAALKSHSEAERRRRERINAHLETLRALLPSSHKMDKAALLAEVICQVKQLKETATHASESFFIPLDSDEIRVETIADQNAQGDGTHLFRASICCDFRPDLLSDLKLVIDSLRVDLLKSEISTLGKRVKNVFVFMIDANIEARESFLTSVHQAFSSVLDKVSSLQEYSPRATYPNKRQRI